MFTNIQRRDERNRRSQRLKDEANFVTPDGLVETLDNPSDIYYKRDSIMHSRNRRVPSYTPGKLLPHDLVLFLQLIIF